MARPVKQGLDYFPLNVVLDEKFDLLEHKHGIVGYAVVLKLWQKIYKKGYYTKWDDMIQEATAFKFDIEPEGLNAIIKTAFRVGLFDLQMYEKYGILTSHGIQKQYFLSVGRRKGVEVIAEFMLVNVPDNVVCVDINGVNVDINQHKPCNNTVNDDIVQQPLVSFSLLSSNNDIHKEQGNVVPENPAHEEEDPNADLRAFAQYQNEWTEKVKSAMLLNGQPFEGIDYQIAEKHIAEYGGEMVVQAIQESAKGKSRTWGYVEGILQRMKRDGSVNDGHIRERSTESDGRSGRDEINGTI